MFLHLLIRQYTLSSPATAGVGGVAGTERRQVLLPDEPRTVVRPKVTGKTFERASPLRSSMALSGGACGTRFGRSGILILVTDARQVLAHYSPLHLTEAAGRL